MQLPEDVQFLPQMHQNLMAGLHHDCWGSYA